MRFHLREVPRAVEGRRVVARGWGRGTRSPCMGTESELLRMKRALGMDGGNGSITMEMFLMPWAWTFSNVKTENFMLHVFGQHSKVKFLGAPG